MNSPAHIISSTTLGAACVFAIPLLFLEAPPKAWLFALGPITLTWVLDEPEKEVSLNDAASKWLEQASLKAFLGFFYAGLMALLGVFLLLVFREAFPKVAVSEVIEVLTLGAAQFLPLIIRQLRKKRRVVALKDGNAP